MGKLSKPDLNIRKEFGFLFPYRLEEINIERPVDTIIYIFWAVKNFSDKHKLHKDWVTNTTYYLHYTEFMSTLYDDHMFEYFLLCEMEKLNFKKELQTALLDFEQTLANYDKNLEEGMEWEHEKILQDPEFDKVIEKAKIAEQLWRKDKEAKKFINPHWETITPVKECPRIEHILNPKKSFWRRLIEW